MTAEDIFEQAAEDIFDQEGIAATYTPSIGDPVTCQIDYVQDVDLEPEGYESQIWGRGKTIEAVLSIIGKEPDADETFTITEGKYIDTVLTVQTVIKNDGLFVTVAVK